MKRIKEILSYFTTYEKCWFVSILALSLVMAILFPEEDVNGINGKLIMCLYMINIFTNIFCELLISKQSRWNFVVSLFVEVTEIIIPILLASRFATMATTIFFWIPIDIISFINWSKRRDREDNSLTKVRKLSGTAKILIIVGVFIWTFVVGSFISNLNIRTDLFGGNKSIETIVAYLDACASAVGVCNGVFILLRIREQWFTWYIEAIMETIINVLSGQWMLLVLKFAYFTNTTYGYFKWTRYIKEHPESVNDLSLL